MDEAGNWTERKDVRYVRVMQGRGGGGMQQFNNWYAANQYDDDTSYAKKVLSELDKFYPGTKGCDVAGFFFWQGEKDCGNAVHAARYEQNLVRFIKQSRKDFNAPDAKFVMPTLGEST